MKIEGKAAIITGASSGLGAEMARQLARMGLKVGLTARRLDRLEEVARSIRQEGGTAIVEAADATDPEATRSAIASITRQVGPIDLLIANAGQGSGNPTPVFSSDAFESLVRVNLLGPAHAIGAVLPSMVERGRGQIVGVSSLAGFRGLPGTSSYSATKAGLSTLLEGLRPPLKRLGIAVTTVHPGYVRTEMTARLDRPMPLLMDVEPAVRIILRGVAARRSRVDFPWRMAALASLLRLLPDVLYDPIAVRVMLGPLSNRSRTSRSGTMPSDSLSD